VRVGGGDGEAPHLAVHHAEAELLHLVPVEADPALAGRTLQHLRHHHVVAKGEHADGGGVEAGRAADVMAGSAALHHRVQARAPFSRCGVSVEQPLLGASNE
jgi:hypothetical protein